MKLNLYVVLSSHDFAFLAAAEMMLLLSSESKDEVLEILKDLSDEGFPLKVSGL